MTDIITETPGEVTNTALTESEKKPDTKVEPKTEGETTADSKPEESTKEETKKEETKKEETTEETTKQEETKKDVVEPINEGVLHKRAPRFMKLWSKSYFVFGSEPVPLENLQVYYRKNAKKFAPTRKPTSGVPSTETTAETTAETSKPSEVVVEEPKGSKETEDKKPETKEVETSEIKESKESEDKKPEIEEVKEVKESEDKKPETKEAETKETKESTKESEEKTIDLNHIFYSNIAHATQTGEGLLFYYRSNSEAHRKHPIGIINLKEVTDVIELHEHTMGKPYSFKVDTSYRVFELAADSKSDRDSWIKTIKEKVEKAKETCESIETSDGYKDTYEKLVKSTAFTPTKPGEVVMPDEVFSGDEVPEEKSRSTETKRKSIFPFFGGGRKPSTSEVTGTTITTTETTEDGSKVVTTTTTTEEVTTDEPEEVKSEEAPKSPQRTSKSFLFSSIFSGRKTEKEESTPADDAKEKEKEKEKDEKITEETTDAETSAAATETTQQKEVKEHKEHKDGGLMNKIQLPFFKSKPKEEGETVEATKVDSTTETTSGDKVEESSEKKEEKEESKESKESEKKDKDDNKKKKDDSSSDTSSSSSDGEKVEPSLVRKVTKIFKRSRSPKASEEKKPESREVATNDKQETTEEIKETPETTEQTDPAQTSEQIVAESSTEQTEDKKKKSSILVNFGRRISSVAKRQNSLSAQESTQEKGEPAETAETQEAAVATAIDATDENADKTVKAEKEPEAAVQKPVIPEGIKSGNLQKQTQLLKQFKSLYFVLTKEKKLHYYRSQSDPTTEKVIDLSADCKVKIIDANKFDLETKTRTYRFIADSGEDCDSWVKELKELGVSSEEPQSTSGDKPEETKKLEVTKSENDDDIQQSVDKAAAAVEASVTEGQETTTTASKAEETVEIVEVKGETAETTTTTTTTTTTITVEENKETN